MARPRQADIDQRLVDAWRELSADAPYERITMEAIAHRAGVGKPALYRRFPTKAHLAFAAGVVGSVPDHFDDHGSLAADLVPVLRALVESLLALPRAVYADQIAAAINDPAFARRVQDEYAGPALDQVSRLWDRAVARGEADASIDGRQALNDLAAALIFDVMVRHHVPDETALGQLAYRFTHGVGGSSARRSGGGSAAARR
ncbi:MAG: TetR/AcrR family transcriptional regulator [Ilumatobacteraceae bacterium]